MNQQDKYVFDADSEKCFDRLGPQALLSNLPTFPALRRTMTAWLKAGVMDGETLFPTDTGAPQGGVRSPLLLHGALHGLEAAMTMAFPASKEGHRWRPRVIRFADDLVVLHRDSHAIAQAQDIAAHWLQEMG
jgi:RNA-directed DNA polymerase